MSLHVCIKLKVKKLKFEQKTEIVQKMQYPQKPETRPKNNLFDYGLTMFDLASPTCTTNVTTENTIRQRLYLPPMSRIYHR